MVAGVQHCDFSATMNARTTSAYSCLFPFLYFSSLATQYAIFLLPSRSYLFSRLLRTAKYHRLIPLQEKPHRQPCIFTADSVTSDSCIPANRESDLQGNYHALIRDYIAHETICCITLLLPSSV